VKNGASNLLDLLGLCPDSDKTNRELEELFRRQNPNVDRNEIDKLIQAGKDYMRSRPIVTAIGAAAYVGAQAARGGSVSHTQSFRINNSTSVSVGGSHNFRAGSSSVKVSISIDF
jgi:hypothetical protein